ncbi:hypothetical protein F4859DRAFT_281169 [Xylaria cf. heliscus]|nr:hypothetical protein F4859DRAFT_281169 [Xylaria cf. heliscus]
MLCVHIRTIQLQYILRSFYDPNDISMHIRRTDLQQLGPNDTSTCPICIPAITMKHMQHLQAHTQPVHGVKSVT